MRKNKFFGIYYKHQTFDGFTIAVIVSKSNEGNMIQVITNEKSYQIDDMSSINVSFEGIEFTVHQEDILISGKIKYGPLLKPKKDIMSYYRFLPIECKHKVYSMYQKLSGELVINGKQISFDNGTGYIEGDRGRNFPSEYVWINAAKKESSLTLAVATIPLGLFSIKGIALLLENSGKEYRFGTYNFAKAKLISRDHIIIKKGKYELEVIIDDINGHALKAPVKGNMVRYIHECPCLPIRYILRNKDNVILDESHPYASFEYTFEK